MMTKNCSGSAFGHNFTFIERRRAYREQINIYISVSFIGYYGSSPSHNTSENELTQTAGWNNDKIKRSTKVDPHFSAQDKLKSSVNFVVSLICMSLKRQRLIGIR